MEIIETGEELPPHRGYIYQLKLQKGFNSEGSVYRVKKGDMIRFCLGASLVGQDVSFFTNHPESQSDSFKRETYRQVFFQRGSPYNFDIFDDYALIEAVQSGSFNFYASLNGSLLAQGYFLVDPELPAVGSSNTHLPLNGLAMQTYLTKNLGKFSEWEKRLEVAHQSGYNMIHLTPIQELGKSQSCYCLRNQLTVSPAYADSDKALTFDDVGALIEKIQKEWGVLAITDLVFNHTANESAWIQRNPECAYNLVNCPHLRPAYLLDRIVWQLSMDIEAGQLADEGIGKTLTESWQLGVIHRYLWRKISGMKLHEFFTANVEKESERLTHFLHEARKKGKEPSGEQLRKEIRLQLKPSKGFKRHEAKVSCIENAAIEFFWNRADSPGRLEAAVSEFRIQLEALNESKYREVTSHLEAAVNNVIANASYRFLDPSGPCFGKEVSATKDTPIMWTYFYQTDTFMPLEKAESFMNSAAASLIMAHNGWVMNDNPLRDFAGPESNVYLRRELIPWGDSVKLRYGDSPKANPVLWEHMKQYTLTTAKVFHGIRLDNCHSTPMHVAQYMMDCARSIRPDFFVIAELFTSSEYTDNIFINKLGITALVREAMSAGDSHEEGRLVYRYGGIPVGSFCQSEVRPLLPTVANAVFYDMTHDNPSMMKRRSRYDLLPSSALVLWADCANGSTRGFDEAVPENVDVVTDFRLYRKWGHGVSHNSAMIGARAALNQLHLWLSKEGFSEIFVDQVSKDVVTVTRHCPKDRRSAILVVHTAFGNRSEDSPRTTRPLPIEGTIRKILFEGTTTFVEPSEFVQDEEVINGLTDFEVTFLENISVQQSKMVTFTKESDSKSYLCFEDFPPGSAFAVLVDLYPEARDAITKLNSISMKNSKALRSTMMDMSNVDINWVLFRCDPEERFSTENGGVYNVPGYGDLNYAGLQGVMSLLSEIRPHNDLGHPLCDNIRNGDWLAGYICSRLCKNAGTAQLGSWMLENFATPLSKIPHYLKPCYFDKVIAVVYDLTLKLLWTRLGVIKSSSLIKAFAMGSIQFYSVVGNCEMPSLSEKLVLPEKPLSTNPESELWNGGLVSQEGGDNELSPTLAAGFPHFSEGIWRNWGRDTFISLPGLLLDFYRWTEARGCILGYAGCLRHGLIPNLLGTAFSVEKGVPPRYNARDAVWFWMAAIRNYVERAPNGLNILSEPVCRFYPMELERRVNSGEISPPSSLTELMAGTAEMKLSEVIYEALSRHAECNIDFVEWGAGYQLDEQMSPEGFHVTAGIDWETGFPYGGNAKNCGTWMDKMGSSDWANNRGVPATPRDGSAVELAGLCYYIVELMKFVSESDDKEAIPFDHKGVKKPDGSLVTWDQWLQLMRNNFEAKFWIPMDVSDSAIRPNRGIYRDSIKSSHGYTDNQFRPNFLVAMAVAPSLFKADNAWRALQRVRNELLGPLGIRTLHSADLAYRGHYNNADDSADFHVAHGFNYHQGPEWLWPVGFYLRAMLWFCKQQNASERNAAIAHVQGVIARHYEVIMTSHWRSLPELTNANGQPCPFSCNAQAWSVATLVEALNALLLCDSESSAGIRWTAQISITEFKELIKSPEIMQKV